MKLKNIEHLSVCDENNIILKKHSFWERSIHWHSYYELELVVCGEGTHIVNGIKYHYRKGDVFLLMPSDYHEFHLDKEGTNYLIEIPPSLFPKDIFDILYSLSDNRITHFEDNEFEIIKNLFLLIENHYQKDGKIYSELTKSLLSTLLYLFVEKITAVANTDIKKINYRLKEIILYIQQNFRADITLDSISKKFFINREYLSSLFKAETGMNLSSYVRKLRLSYAAFLAKNTDMKSIDICENSGFNSVPSFLRNFKNEYKVSPLEMRKNSLKHKN